MIPPTPARPLITETLVNTNSRETHLATNNSTGRRNNGLSSADVTLRRLVTLVLGAEYKYSYIHTYITICRARCGDSTEYMSNQRRYLLPYFSITQPRSGSAPAPAVLSRIHTARRAARRNALIEHVEIKDTERVVKQ